MAAIPRPTRATRSPTATTTTRAPRAERFGDHFGDQAEAFLVFNGTGANVVALQALTRPLRR